MSTRIEIQDVMKEIVALQKSIPTPTGEKPLVDAYDEHPMQVSAFPCFVNVERKLDDIVRQSGGRQRAKLYVEMQLLFAQSGEKYSQRSARKWVQAALDHFDQHQGLNNTAASSEITVVYFDDPVGLSEQMFIGVRFLIEITMKAADVDLAM